MTTKRSPRLSSDLASASCWQIALLAAAVSLLSSALVGAFIARHLPDNHDQCAYLLQGQTFSHFRLTNPTHPLWRFFETPHELMRPTYTGKYPPGQGMAIAVGFWLGKPIYGIWLEGALLAACVVWMLRGFFPNRWALLGGVLCILQFGFGHLWAQSYWGGALCAAGGALVFGGLRRLWKAVPRTRDSVLLGLGVSILMLTRPFEGALACIVPAAALLWPGALRSWRALLPCALVIASAFGWQAYYNHRVTGSAWRMPYLEYERQYSSAPLFVWQPYVAEPGFENAAMRDFYRSFVLPNSRFASPAPVVWARRVGETARQMLGVDWMLVAALGLVWRPRRWSLLAAACIAAGSAAFVLSYWYLPQYEAPLAAAFLFLAVAGLRALVLGIRGLRRRFVLVAGAVLLARAGIMLAQGEPMNEIRFRNTITAHQWAADILARDPHKSLVFIHREMPYNVHLSFVFNGADIDQEQHVFAWDRGPAENAKLLAYYPARRAYMITETGDNMTFLPYGVASQAK